MLCSNSAYAVLSNNITYSVLFFGIDQLALQLLACVVCVQNKRIMLVQGRKTAMYSALEEEEALQTPGATLDG